MSNSGSSSLASSILTPDPNNQAVAANTNGQGFQLGDTIAPVGPNINAYNQQINAANAAGGQYLNEAQTYSQNAPTIANPYQAQSQAGLAATLGQTGNVNAFGQNLMQNGSTIAANQYQQSLGNSIAANMALANSTNGGPAALAAAQRQAQQQNAQTLAGASSQAAIMQAQQQQAGAQLALGATGQMSQQQLAQYQLEQGNAQQQAQLQLGNQAQQNQMQLGLAGVGTTEQGLASQNLNAVTQGQQNQQSLQLQGQAQAAKNTGGLVGGIGSFVGDVAKAYTASDERLKGDVRNEGERDSLVDDFLRQMDPKSYRYRQGLDPNGIPAGPKYLGVMAQDIERVPQIGHTIVKDTPAGKVIDNSAGLSAALAGIARLDEKVRELQGLKGKR